LPRSPLLCTVSPIRDSTARARRTPLSRVTVSCCSCLCYTSPACRSVLRRAVSYLAARLGTAPYITKVWSCTPGGPGRAPVTRSVRARACLLGCVVSCEPGVSLLDWRPLALVCTWPLGPVWAGYFCELCVGAVVVTLGNVQSRLALEWLSAAWRRVTLVGAWVARGGGTSYPALSLRGSGAARGARS